MDEESELTEARLSEIARAILPVFALFLVMAFLPRILPMPALVFQAIGAVFLTLIAFSAHRFVLKGERGIAALRSAHLPRFAALTILFWFAMRYVASKLQLGGNSFHEAAWYVPRGPDVVMFILAVIAALWLFSKVALTFPATALGKGLSNAIKTVTRRSLTEVFFRSLFQTFIVFAALAMIGAMFTNLRISGWSKSEVELASLGLFAAKECVIALWVIALSGMLGSLYQREFPTEREN